MLGKIKNRFKEKENRVLLSNFFSLSALNMATYLFPLITFPYLVRVLGVEIFGVLAMATAIVTYFKIITDYGFDLSATKEISVHRADKSKVVEIFNSVMIIKLILLIISFLLFSILVFSFERFSQYWEVYYFTFGLLIGQTLLPIWFFQGMENMKYITILTIISKTIFTLSIFIFIKTKEDFILVPFFYALGAILSGLMALYIINKRFEVNFVWQPIAIVKKYFIEGWDIFMQRLYVSLHSNTNIIVLGLLTNDAIVGVYSIAARLIAIIGDIFKIVSRTYYPYFAKKYSTNPIKSFLNLKKLVKFMFLLSFVSMLLMFLLDEWLVKLITGSNYDARIIDVLNILNLTIIILPFFALFTNVLIAINQGKKLKYIARDTAIVSMIFVAPIVYFFSEIGLAYLVLFLQSMIMYRYSKIILQEYRRINVKGQV